MKNVPAVNWPMPLADLNHPERWPLRGRNDHAEGMAADATLTPSAGLPEEEVTTDEGSE